MLNSQRGKEEKRTILAALGLNPTLEYKKLRLYLLKPFESMQEAVVVLKKEAEEFEALAHAGNIDVIYLLAPTSTPERIKMISSRSRGFVYYVSITGVTGTQSGETGQLTQKIGDIKKVATQPVLIGFGISGPDQARAASEISDGVIVGSAIVKIIEQCSNAEERLERVGAFVRDIKQALNGS